MSLRAGTSELVVERNAGLKPVRLRATVACANLNTKPVARHLFSLGTRCNCRTTSLRGQ